MLLVLLTNLVSKNRNRPNRPLNARQTKYLNSNNLDCNLDIFFIVGKETQDFVPTMFF